VQCPLCKLFFNNCEHSKDGSTPCGTTVPLTNALAAQKPIKAIHIEFMDGTKATIRGHSTTTTTTTLTLEESEDEDEEEAEPEDESMAEDESEENSEDDD